MSIDRLLCRSWQVKAGALFSRVRLPTVNRQDYVAVLAGLSLLIIADCMAVNALANRQYLPMLKEASWYLETDIVSADGKTRTFRTLPVDNEGMPRKKCSVPCDSNQPCIEHEP